MAAQPVIDFVALHKIALNATQFAALRELSAACDESLRFNGDGWTKTFHLSGTKAERSSTVLKQLEALGLVESKRWGHTRQSQYRWRITPAGRVFEVIRP